jgi:hypothetical protein
MDHVKECVLENRLNFVCKVANVLGIADWSVPCILNGNVKMLQIATKFVPQLPSEEQKENHIKRPRMPFNDNHMERN